MSDAVFEDISEIWTALRNYTSAFGIRMSVVENKLTVLESKTELTDAKNALNDTNVSSLISEIQSLRDKNTQLQSELLTTGSMHNQAVTSAGWLIEMLIAIAEETPSAIGDYYSRRDIQRSDRRDIANARDWIMKWV